MTTLLEEPQVEAEVPKTIEKVSIVVSKGSLEGVLPGLIMANGARMDGIEANLFFTFFGLDAIRKDKVEKIKVATVGNPAMHMASLLGILPGMSSFATHKMKKEMEKLDIPDVPEFIELCADSGVGIYACEASVQMFRLTEADFVPQVDKILTVGEFYELSAGGEIIFT